MMKPIANQKEINSKPTNKPKIEKSNNLPVKTNNNSQTKMGTLEKSVIDAYVRRNRAKINWCYEKELNKNSNLSGKIIINFVISETGSVISSKVQKTTMDNTAVESCVANQIKKIRFPAPQGGGIVIVNYPFVF